MFRTSKFLGAAVLVALLPALACAADSDADREHTRLASDVSVLLWSAHVAMSDFQDRINDALTGDKGVTSAVVADATRVIYEKSTGKHLEKDDSNSRTAIAQRALMQAIHDVMGPAQAVINAPGKGYKGFLPAVFTRQVAEHFNKTMNGQIVLKITAPKVWVRNKSNTPDEWEDRMIETELKSAKHKKGRPVAESVSYDGKPALRFMLPEYYTESCLMCHGEPRGELDITGTPREGGKLGDLGGAISAVVFK